jgi:hypothetical protein
MQEMFQVVVRLISYRKKKVRFAFGQLNYKSDFADLIVERFPPDS